MDGITVWTLTLKEEGNLTQLYSLSKLSREFEWNILLLFELR